MMTREVKYVQKLFQESIQKIQVCFFFLYLGSFLEICLQIFQRCECTKYSGSAEMQRLIFVLYLKKRIKER